MPAGVILLSKALHGGALGIPETHPVAQSQGSAAAGSQADGTDH